MLGEEVVFNLRILSASDSSKAGKKASEFKDDLESFAPKEFTKEDCERLIRFIYFNLKD